MSDVRIKTKVIIEEVISHNTYHATLPNGKRILAYTKPLDHIPLLEKGQEYGLLMSLCNFDEGRLVPQDLAGIRLENPVVESGI